MQPGSPHTQHRSSMVSTGLMDPPFAGPSPATRSSDASRQRPHVTSSRFSLTAVPYHAAVTTSTAALVGGRSGGQPPAARAGWL